MKKEKFLLILIGAFSLCSCGKKPEEPIIFHEHVLRHVAEKSPTFAHHGNIDHYYCTDCGAYFDKNLNQITQEETVWKLDIYNLIESKDPVFFIGGDLSYDYDREAVDKFFEEGDKLLEDIASSLASASAINNWLAKLRSVYDTATNSYDSISLLADLYNTEYYYSLKSHVYNTYLQYNTWYYKVRVALAKNSYYHKEFFSGYTSSEIQRYIEQNTPAATGETTSAESKMEEIIAKYKSGLLDRFDAYSQYVTQANLYAKNYGYANYMTFSYPNVYGRQYSVADSANLGQYVKNYINPLYQTIESKLKNALLPINPNFNEYVAAAAKITELSSNFYGCMFNELTDYAKFIGTSYYKSFVDLFENNRFYYSNVDNANITAYVTYFKGHPIMFMSKDYQSFETFIHEFGHYNADCNYNGGIGYDLAEVQSQGNEMLFYYYLLQNYNFNEYEKELFLLQELRGMLQNVIVGYIINEVEKFAYSNQFTKAQLEQKWIDINVELQTGFETNIDYLYAVLLNYHCYYISYAVSAVAALEVFGKCIENFTEAKKSYVSLFIREARETGFTSALEIAGLYNVFSESAYTLINNISTLL